MHATTTTTTTTTTPSKSNPASHPPTHCPPITYTAATTTTSHHPISPRHSSSPILTLTHTYTHTQPLHHIPSPSNTPPFIPRVLRRLPLARQPHRPPRLQVPLGEPLARLDQLHDVDDLLERHDGEADAREDPGPEAVHLVDASELEGARAVRVRKDVLQEGRVDLRALVDRLGGVVGDGLQEGGGE